MYKPVKVLHIIGVIMFFGSILTHAIAGVVSSASDNTQVLHTVREVIQTETYFLTIPGFILFTITGITLLFVGKLPITKLRWLAVHVCLGILVILNAVFILLPVGTEILEASQNMVIGTGSIEDFQQLKNKEAIFGALNIISCLVLVTLAVIEPKLGAK